MAHGLLLFVGQKDGGALPWLLVWEEEDRIVVAGLGAGGRRRSGSLSALVHGGARC